MKAPQRSRSFCICRLTPPWVGAQIASMATIAREQKAASPRPTRIPDSKV